MRTIVVTNMTAMKYGEIEKAFLEKTTAQWNEYKPTIRGKGVQWQGRVAEVSKDGEDIPVWVEVPRKGSKLEEKVFFHTKVKAAAGGLGYSVWVEMPGGRSVLAGNVFLQNVSRETALKLQKGQRIHFRGTIDKIRTSRVTEGDLLHLRPGIYLKSIRILGD